MAGSSRTSLSKDLGISSNNNFPPELVERMNKAPKHRFTSPFETSSGGFVPYTSMTRRSASLGATTLRSNPTVAHVSETSHWLTRHQIGDLPRRLGKSTIEATRSGLPMNIHQVFF